MFCLEKNMLMVTMLTKVKYEEITDKGLTIITKKGGGIANIREPALIIYWKLTSL